MTTEAEKAANTAALVNPHGVLVGTTDPDEMDGGARYAQQQIGQAKLQRTLANIHAVARHLFNITDVDAEELYVGVQPLGNVWRVQVSYAGFDLRVKEPFLTEALEKTLAKLMTQVGRRLDDDTRLLAALNPGASRIGTHDAIAHAVKLVAGVAEATFQEDSNEPGMVTAYVLPDHVMTIEERDQFSAEIGMALGKSSAAIVRFRVKILGLFTTP